MIHDDPPRGSPLRTGQPLDPQRADKETEPTEVGSVSSYGRVGGRPPRPFGRRGDPVGQTFAGVPS
jgi:hypothetical protein